MKNKIVSKIKNIGERFNTIKNPWNFFWKVTLICIILLTAFVGMIFLVTLGLSLASDGMVSACKNIPLLSSISREFWGIIIIIFMVSLLVGIYEAIHYARSTKDAYVEEENYEE